MALYAGGIIMSLSINVANNLKEDQNSFWKTNEVETKESKNSGTFFAGNLNQETDLKSRIEQRRQLAQNQAMKLVGLEWKEHTIYDMVYEFLLRTLPNA